MKRHPILLLLAASLISIANVLSGEGRTCRIVFPERSADAPKVAYLSAGQTSQQVNLPSKNFSGVIDLPEGDLTILMTPDEVTDFENLPADAPRLQVAKPIRDFYILVTADPSNELLPIEMELIDLKEGEFKSGQTLWLNRTNHVISAKLGESKLLVEPNSREVSSSPVSESGYYEAEFSYKADGKGEFQKITEQGWWHDMESRHLGFILNKGGKLPKIHYYRDFRP